MKFNTLGSTGLRVSQLGFGAWGLGGDAYGAVDKTQALTALNFAFDSGINFYDTSNLYGAGRSEEILGEAFCKRRDAVTIASKFGLLPHTGRALPGDYSAGNIRKCLEGSLLRLRSDYVDFYQFHSPPLEALRTPEAFATLDLLKKEGKIRSYGASLRSPKDALSAIRNHSVSAVQVNFNMIDHRAIDDGLLTTAQELGVGVIARTPLCFGFLTGALNESDLPFGDSDHRRFYPREQLLRWLDAPKLFEPMCANRTATELALRFCFDSKGITTTIPGMLNVDQVKENLALYSKPELTQAEYSQIQTIYRDKLFFDPKLSYRPPK